MSTPERSHTVRSAPAVEGAQEHAGTNVMSPPAFQLQASPLAPVQRQTQPRQEGQQEESSTEGGESQVGDSGRVSLQQSVTPAHAEPEQVAPAWDAFAVAFSNHFMRVLPEFDPTVDVSGVSRSRAISMARGENPSQPAAGAAPAATEAPNAETPNRRASRGRRGRRSSAAASSGAQVQVTPAASARENEPAALPRISGARLAQLFSEFHRTELSEYFRTHRIPPVLFNGGDVGHLSDSQRLVLSAHILTYGLHERGEHLAVRQERVDAAVAQIRQPQLAAQQRQPAQPAAQPQNGAPAQPVTTDTNSNANSTATPAVANPSTVSPAPRTPLLQRVHAHNCGDWALYVTQYAGLTQRTGATGGVYSSFDLMGHLNTGNARYHETMGGRAERASAISGRTESEQGGDLQGGQAAAAGAIDMRTYNAQMEVYRAALARGNPEHLPEPRNPLDNFGRHPQVSWEAIQTIRPGDWLWIYNANPDRMGSHSVIFVRWLERETRLPRSGGAAAAGGQASPNGTFRARRALCYSQHSPESGGVDDEVMIGEMFASGAKPVTLIRHMETDHALTPEELLPNQSNAERANVGNANDVYLHGLGRRPEVQRTFDQAAFATYLMGRNTELIEQLAGRHTQVQMGAAQQPSILSVQQRRAFESANTQFGAMARQGGTSSNAEASAGEGQQQTPAPNVAETQRRGLMQLVMLYQRLVQFNENAATRQALVANQVTGANGVEREHQRWEERQAVEAALTPRERAARRRFAAAHPPRGGAPSNVEPYAFSIPGGGSRSTSQVTGLVENTFDRELLLQYFTIPGAPSLVRRIQPRQGNPARHGAGRPAAPRRH